jgi:H+-translocating NAD(P) transhydrogenase subunit alpha
LIIGILKETAPGEKRVAIVPDSVSKLKVASVLVEHDAGAAAGFSDDDYTDKGASIVNSSELLAKSDIILKVQSPTEQEALSIKSGAATISFLYALDNQNTLRNLVKRQASAFAMELMPRISRAQSMDALSSQAVISGYKAVLLAADALPKLFPLLMTAAGTIPPAKVFVIGAGVAGLEAIAVAHRLGAVVEAYDVRPAAKEQVESLRAKFIELPIETADAQTTGGYAKAQSEDFYRKQQQLLAERAAAADVVITTALVPGKRAPLLVSEEAVKGMRFGSVIVDLACEQGGNCALTEPGKTVNKYGVNIIAPFNLPSSVAPQASQLYSRNIVAFLSTMLKDGILNIDIKDALVSGTLVTRDGEVLNEAVRTALAQGG